MSYTILALLRNVHRYRHKEFEYFYIPKIIYDKNDLKDYLYGMFLVSTKNNCKEHHIYFRKQKI